MNPLVHPRRALYLLLMLAGTFLAFLRPQAPAKVCHPAIAGLTFAERVSYQKAIEEVYWRHRIWPNANTGPKPRLDNVMSQTQTEKKVEDYLRNSQALEDYWQRPIIPDQLQAEMERMAQHTKQPEVLHELFEALGNDPFVIAECLARPALSERLVTTFYAHDQRFHGQLKRRVEADLRTHHSLKQMKQTSGNYSEIELVKSDSAQDEDNRGAETGLKMNRRDWDENVQKLEAMFATANPSDGGFGGAKNGRTRSSGAPITQIKTGVLSSLQEDDGRYYAVAVVEKSDDRLKLATVEWRKEPLESWRARAERQTPKVMAATSANYTLPTISGEVNGCTDDAWTDTNHAPINRYSHTAVWTGSEMIVWGGTDGGSSLNTGERYNPSTDSWTDTTTTNAPSARYYHTAVWTGSEMIVWGGFDGTNFFNTGGRYNPSTDSWTDTTTTNVPTARYYHTAVWTGSEMIVWGGIAPPCTPYEPGCVFLNTGGRYNPGTDSWTATSTTNTPSARSNHTAVWTGSEMIVWGGIAPPCTPYYPYCVFLNTGGRYNPATDSWADTSTNNAPDGRDLHTAVWTGSEMIVWGGSDQLSGFGFNPLNTGGRYNPSTDSWTATSLTNAPAGRYYHTAVWNITGSEMIVWGGIGAPCNPYCGLLNTGGRYNPSTDSWTAISTTNAPSGRANHTAVWTGSEMIVWGGFDVSGDSNTGGRYDPGTDTWTATSTTNAPSGRANHTAVWTGSEMIIWGGGDNTGGKYNPSTDSWTATSLANAPTGRGLHTAVWTGSAMIVWGGFDNVVGYSNTGGRYNPSTDSWTDTTTNNAPTGRSNHTAIWSGSEMIVWGGLNVQDFNIFYLNTGGRYNPSTDSWTATNTSNAPTGRAYHTAVWTGGEMIVWGGYGGTSFLFTGGRYDPVRDSWTATEIGLSARSDHTAVWTASEMIVWGGFFNNGTFQYLNTGGRYNPATNSWTATSITNAPAGRRYHTAVWSGSEMIVWGGLDQPSGLNNPLNTGGRYNPSTDSWTATSLTNAPTGRYYHTAVWNMTGSEMIVWGGQDNGSVLNTGGRYCAAVPTGTPTPTPTSSPSPTPTSTATPAPTPRVTPPPRPRPTRAPRPTP